MEKRTEICTGCFMTPTCMTREQMIERHGTLGHMMTMIGLAHAHGDITFQEAVVAVRRYARDLASAPRKNKAA
jgi:hypothetical protein